MNRSSLRAFLLLPFLLACFALSPQARATCQEGCLTNNNTVLGDDALLNNTGSDNTAIGYKALIDTTTGGENTAIGSGALFLNQTGNQNTAIRWWALFNNTSSANTAVGNQALQANTTGTDNTANGAGALEINTTGSYNTATGVAALGAITGSNNTAMGYAALFGNYTGSNNTATGFRALYSNTGDANTATGVSALFGNTTGIDNTANGVRALAHNTTGRGNIALGFEAGIGLTTGNNNIDIGNAGVTGESGTIRIGAGSQTNTYIAGISWATVPSGVAVIVDSSGHLGTTTSSARFKEAIKPMDKASEAILALKPVTFRYKHELDPQGTPQFGLVAEQVEKVNPDLVARDADGKPYSVRYEAVNAMLLNEFLKEHKKVEELEATVGKLQAQGEEIAELKAALKQQAAQLQKVSARLEANTPAMQLVDNP